MTSHEPTPAAHCMAEILSLYPPGWSLWIGAHGQLIAAMEAWRISAAAAPSWPPAAKYVCQIHTDAETGDTTAEQAQDILDAHRGCLAALTLVGLAGDVLHETARWEAMQLLRHWVASDSAGAARRSALTHVASSYGDDPAGLNGHALAHLEREHDARIAYMKALTAEASTTGTR